MCPMRPLATGLTGLAPRCHDTIYKHRNADQDDHEQKVDIYQPTQPTGCMFARVFRSGLGIVVDQMPI